MRFFDLHCDTMGECSLKDIPLRNNRTLQISLERAGNFFRLLYVYLFR